MSVNTYVVMLAHGEVHAATKVATAVLLAAGATFVTGLPLGALLGMLPRGFGRPGIIVAWVAVVLAIALAFVSEQTLLRAISDEDPVDFILTGWLWDHSGWVTHQRHRDDRR